MLNVLTIRVSKMTSHCAGSVQNERIVSPRLSLPTRPWLSSADELIIVMYVFRRNLCDVDRLN